MHLGVTSGLLATRGAAAAPADLRGTAFGFFNLLSGLTVLLASALAGWRWDQFGPVFTFSAGAWFGGLALAGIALLPPARFGGVNAHQLDRD